MVRSLKESCLSCLACNLHSINRVGHYLATRHKELLLEWLVYHDRLTPEYLPHITYHLFSSGLRTVNFYKCQQVTDAVLTQLGDCGCKLRSITIHGCSDITDAGMVALLQHQDELEVLELRKLPHLVTDWAQAVMSPVLEHLDLNSCTSVEAPAVCRVVSSNPTMRTVILAHCHRLGENINTLVQRVAQALNNNMLLVSCLQLQKLDLSYCYKVTSQTAPHILFHLPERLQFLSLCGVQLPYPQTLEGLTKLRRLEELVLCGITTLTVEVMDMLLPKLGGSLVHLDLSGCTAVDDVLLRSVSAHCVSLQRLVLSFCTQVTGVTLLPIFEDPERAQNITCLIFTACVAMSMEVLQVIASKCVNLERFHVAGLADVRDDLLLTLASNCPKLSNVTFKSCNQLTDASVCELSRCCPLREVVLSGVRSLTDRSILSLANSCQHLDCVYVSGCTQVTTAALRYLQDCCVKRVHIEHKTPNMDPNQLMAKNLDTGEYLRVDQMAVS
ncbi:PREDICTED: F-box/LRR-repeat protein 2-like [Branchiostoma belcheri]|uniref:F-box/LRR-repeat protein 2-like n=1 Tax=Branchiostoma belcheri TaxID=7741 RepID=A0A6P4Z8D3_BRABE|nr:PREDICTED: F-box/LRR-repeat protein 2-like [Branchiostoma belcheri]